MRNANDADSWFVRLFVYAKEVKVARTDYPPSLYGSEVS